MLIPVSRDTYLRKLVALIPTSCGAGAIGAIAVTRTEYSEHCYEVIFPPMDGQASYECQRANFAEEPATGVVLAMFERMIAQRQERREQWAQITTVRAQESAAYLACQVRERTTAQDLLDDPYASQLIGQLARTERNYSQELVTWWAPRREVVAAVEMMRKRLAAEKSEREERRKAREECEAPVREAVMAAYRRCGYRHCRNRHTVTVEVRQPGALADVESWTRRGKQYSSRCQFRKLESHHRIVVPMDWRERIAGVGPSFAGQLILDANFYGIRDGRAYFSLITVKQGRGTALEKCLREVMVLRDGQVIETQIPKKLDLDSFAAFAGLSKYTPADIVADALLDQGYEALATMARVRRSR